MKRLFSLFLCGFFFFTGNTRAEEFIQLEFKPLENGAAENANNNDFYLAPELKILVEGKISLAGISKQGELSFRLLESTKIKIQEIPIVKDLKSINIPETELKPAELIIGYKDDAKHDDVKNALIESGFQIREDFRRGRFFVVVAKENGTQAIQPEMIEALQGPVKNQGAKSATPNYKIENPEPKESVRENRTSQHSPQSDEHIPGDSRWSELWGMKNINAPKAWSTVKDSPTIVAVIDTGTDYTHRDLSDNIWTNKDEIPGNNQDDDNNNYVDDVHGYDFFSKDGDPNDGGEHGTHVAGTIGAVADDFGVVGVSHKVKIMPVRFLGPNGGSTQDAIKATYYAIDNGAKIINNSWGGGPFSPDLFTAYQECRDKEILVVCAAGNHGRNNDQSPYYPATYNLDNVISVARIERDESLASSSGHGKNTVDIAAPGGQILSTVPGDTHASFNGTSMSTPHVSGALALIDGHPEHSQLGFLEKRQLIMDESRKLPSLVGKCDSEGTLDISFLHTSVTPPTKLTGVWMDSVEIGHGQVTLSESNDSIAKIGIRLESRSLVYVIANTSALASSEQSMDIQLVSDSGDWSEAVRFIDLPDDKWTGITISHAAQVAEGDHTLSWIGLVNNSVLLDGGSLTVIVYPLPEAATDVISIAREDVESIKVSQRNRKEIVRNRRSEKQSRQSDSQVERSQKIQRDPGGGRPINIHIEVNPSISN